ncbi:uncharacterized protein PHACADRAFT_187466 [Phanerochaete carnosa HHB-10118-sp]|uniref:Uncharacterized protein n=1 Tax=Phanerochaete carnosa (strain HHB-10118-sp) TaxID=650164 RepID=K5WP67_PHACS|nr:uncharacterized protein PHACADRAFT_187466 [Phanerochaete carnosa HHB-10118-sp]EKM52132.1 hypothetical protein PHACADRAFT_187466 [Phanerochaete carnosa HHB-10118-sp]
MSWDILLLILDNGRRVQWDLEHEGFTFDSENDIGPADYEDILCHLPIDSNDSAMRDHVKIFVAISVRWLRSSSLSEMSAAKVTAVLQRMISAANFISAHDRRRAHWSYRGEYDGSWIEAVENQVKDPSPYDNLFLQLLHAFERSYRRHVLTGRDRSIRRHLHIAHCNLHARADCKIAGCSWRQHSCGGDEDNFFLGCPLLDKQADTPGEPSSGGHSVPETFATTDVLVTDIPPASPSDFDRHPTPPEDAHQSAELSVSADSITRTDDGTQEDPSERNKPASIAGHPLHPSILQASSLSSAAAGLSVGEYERAASGRSSAGLRAYDEHGVSEENVADQAASSPAHVPGFHPYVVTPSNVTLESTPSAKAQPGVSGLKPDAKPVAHREPPDSDIGAKRTSRSEAQVEAEDHAPQSLAVAIPSFAEEAAGGRSSESYLPETTGETDDNSGAVKDRGKGPSLDEPAAHELVNSDSPNPAGMRPSQSSSSSSRRDDSLDPTGLLRQDSAGTNASAARNSDGMLEVLQNSPSDDLAIARNGRSDEDRVAELRRLNSPVLSGAAVLFRDDSGVDGQAVEEFELALQQGATSEDTGDQGGVEV